MSRSSRSSAIYARLLALYPSEIRRGHREEMMQNFDDLERASSSTWTLWLALSRDLVTAVWAHWVDALYDGPGSFTRQSRIIGAVLAVILAIAWVRHPEHWLIALAFCGGYAVGWVSGWSRRRAVIVLIVLGIVIAVSTRQRVLLTIGYGCTLGGLTGWRGRTKSMSGHNADG